MYIKRHSFSACQRIKVMIWYKTSYNYVSFQLNQSWNLSFEYPASCYTFERLLDDWYRISKRLLSSLFIFSADRPPVRFSEYNSTPEQVSRVYRSLLRYVVSALHRRRKYVRIIFLHVSLGETKKRFMITVVHIRLLRYT